MDLNEAILVAREWTGQQGLALEDSTWERLRQYHAILTLFAPSMNLVSSADSRAFFLGHVCDSLFVAKAIPTDSSLLDVGSGAGLPGLVLACALPEKPIGLLEPRARRIAFLTEVVRRLGLKAVSVVRGRFPDQHVPLPAPRVFVSRATFDPRIWLEGAMARADHTDFVLVMATEKQMESLRDELADVAAPSQGIQEWAYRLPDGRNRLLLRVPGRASRG